MPSIPRKTKSISEINTADMLNSLAVNAGLNDMPVVHSGDVQSLKDFGNAIINFQGNSNAFLGALINRIGRVIITSKMYENPWSVFKRGLMEYGETIEEIFISMAEPYTYNPSKTENTDFKRYIPDVKSVFHSMNFQKFYPTTVSEAQLRQAFLSFEGVNELISRIIQQVYTGANYDEFIVMKYMLARNILAGQMYAVNVPQPTTDNARAVAATMVDYGMKIRYISDEFNHAHVRTNTELSEMYMIIPTNFNAIMDVEVLALSFNMTKAELLGRQIGVDGFGILDNERLAMLFAENSDYTPITPAEMQRLNSVVGVMVDRNYFMIFDNNIFMSDIFSPVGLYWTYYYHNWKTFSTSPFCNAILFTTETPAITSIAISPNTATVVKGNSIKFTAVIQSTGFADSSVKWEVSGDGVNAVISADGTLTVSTAETATELTVTATSIFDPTKSATAAVTVQ
jgi:hypothetical protein|nr:MAG TPA: Head protein [Caudoviricetes sp.]